MARDSYALTLYTQWHLEQRRRLTLIAQKSERLDLAGLMAGAFHKPQSLVEHHAAFMAELRPLASSHARESTAARQLAIVRAAHAATEFVTLLPS